MFKWLHSTSSLLPIPPYPYETYLRKSAQRRLDGQGRPAFVRPSVPHDANGLCPGRLGWPPHHRHHQHLVRPEPLSQPLQAARGRREARRVPGGRVSGGASGDFGVGIVRETHHHALSQLPGHGNRRAAAQPSGGWRGADGRLRQDHAGPAHGRHQRRIAMCVRARWPHAARQLEGQDPGLGL
ncbi:hypothetical protein D3C78_1194410 [compost metagenome]